MTASSSSSSLCFVDTNIWLYAFIQTQDSGKQVMAKNVIQDNEVILSSQVINETCVNLLKKTSLSEPELQALIRSFYSHYPVIEADQEMLLRASELREKHSFAYWDSLIVAGALLAGCDCLYSEDMQDGLQVDGKLTIQNPFK
jgi:predicted nucleic acid-binding protein